MTPRALVLAVVVVAMSVMTGCERGEYMAEEKEQAARMHAQLQKLPSLEETERQVELAMRQVAATAAAIVPSLRWYENHERLEGSCGHPYSNAGGGMVYTVHLVSDNPIPDSDWPQVLTAVRDVAAKAGMPGFTMMADKPGNRLAELYGDIGSMTIGYKVATVIGAQTACRLPAAKLKPGS